MAEAETNILSWSVANWITVVLMVCGAFLVSGAVARVWQSRNGFRQS